MTRRRVSLRCLAAMLSVFLLLTMVISPVRGTEAEELEEKLKELQQQEENLSEEIATLEEDLHANAGEIGALVEQKNLLDRQITLLMEQITNVTEQIRVCSGLVADKQAQLDSARQALSELNARHKERIRAMEEAGRMSIWEVLFGADSFMDFLDRLEMVEEIARSDAARLQQIRQASEEVASALEELLRSKETMVQTRSQLETTQKTLLAKREEAEALLRELLEKGRAFELLLEEAELKQSELMEEIAKTEQAWDDAKYQQWLENQKPVNKPQGSGKWLTPVEDYYISSPFGMRMHPILGIERMHNGIDMACPAMTPIYATRDGVVSVASYQADGAGNYVQLDHGDGYRSIYMHMTYYTVSVGQYVQQGQLIGYVGNTGLSKGNHLHFGISYQGVYQNPVKFIG